MEKYYTTIAYVAFILLLTIQFLKLYLITGVLQQNCTLSN